ncbi:MAG: MBL fold metallo-hydrolase [Acidobacteria bacterium]|nr:MAG: MBL fold metallo-hydrolase [Acidobacteriota bacterium]
MEIRVLGSYGGSTLTTRLTSFLINSSVAVDAGCLTQTLELEEQSRITDVLISHSHMDHICSLPFLMDNIFGQSEQPLRVWGSHHVVTCLKKHVFNNVIWPDFSKIYYQGWPSIEFCTIEPGKSFSINDLEVTAIPVNHIVPTHAFYIEDSQGGFLFSSDTCNTDEVWEFANLQDNLKAIIVDCSFPNAMKQLAVDSGHMTPELLSLDLKKLKRACDIYIYHAKSSYEEQLHRELDALGLQHLHRYIQGQVIRI